MRFSTVSDPQPEADDMLTPTTTTVTTMFMSYTTTPTSFIKRSLPSSQLSQDGKGNYISRQWTVKRILNEAAALDLVSKRTTIPVPKLISFGTNDDGTAWLEVERIFGLELNLVTDQCRMPKDWQRPPPSLPQQQQQQQKQQRQFLLLQEREKSHSRGGPCYACFEMAKMNAERFIECVVLPQLRMLRSCETGLNGFMLPPPWVLEYDKRENWNPICSDKPEFVFCHGDLTSHNIMVHPQTLHVMSIFDWEYAGFFPEAFQLWAIDRREYFMLFTDEGRLRELVNFIESESTTTTTAAANGEEEGKEE